MIVIPQLFNYRLIIGSLSVAVLVLGSYSFISTNSLRQKQEFMQQEQKLVSNELSQVLSLYNALENEYTTLQAQLATSEKQAKQALDSLKILKYNQLKLAEYKQQVQALLQEKNTLEKQLKLISSKQAPEWEIPQPQEHTQTGTVQPTASVSEKAVKNTVQLASFNACAISKSLLGKPVKTTKAKRVNYLEVCFTLTPSYASLEGTELYIQVLNPSNNVMANKGVVSFGNSSLIFSKKAMLTNLETTHNFCETIAANTGEPFAKGLYFVNVFHQDKLIENTTIELN